MVLANLGRFWSGDVLAANVFIALHLLGALLLGMLVGYERSYQGRAAGMRTYGLVCMASAALTVFVGVAPLWFGGSQGSGPADATRVVQGIVTGVGFLGAGVIVKDGLSVTGLTTAASIWASSAIGVLVGVGFYPAAIVLAVLCMLAMTWLQRIEQRLPARARLDVTLASSVDNAPGYDEVEAQAQSRGYAILRETLNVSYADDLMVWRFQVLALDRTQAAAPATLAQALATAGTFIRFSVSPVRH
ncbi:MAG TPA: MgtC/SapB family protein [Caldimonas sp.]|jgi:putative Mg2+ transporter-C (MgtC) family protein